jgi:hypothetical protein
MATKALYRRALTGWVPADPEAEAFTKGFKVGAHVWLEGSRPVNWKFRKKFFAMLQIVYNNQDHYESFNRLRAACLVAIGHADFFECSAGMVGVPRSIAWARCTDDEFDGIYNRAVDWVLAKVIPGLERQGLDEAVEAELREFAG